MRLFLSSQDFGRHADLAAKMAGSNKKAAFIKNAQDAKPPAERNFNTPLKKQMFEDAGFTFEEVDLRDYFGKKDELSRKLDSFGSIWGAGGNVHVLRRAMNASGLDEILKEWLLEDKVMYGGWSAGAMVMAPDLEGPLWSEEDEPGLTPEGYNPEVLWDGLSLVPFYVVPHYGSELHGKSPQTYVDYYELKGLEHYILEDGQVVVVDGPRIEFLK